jgi:putative transposase of IS4/5 family DUF4096
VFDGVLFVLRTGCAWAALPRDDPPRSTCQDRLPLGIESGVFAAVLSDLAADLQAGDLRDLRECFLDGSFAPAQRGAAVGQTKKGQGSQIRAVVEAHGLPVAVPSTAPPRTRSNGWNKHGLLAPRMGDKAEDSDRPDADLAPAGIEWIAPHRKSRKNRTQKR